jgi:hypothetical protein
MMSNQGRLPSAPACIEMLESRRLMSASVTSHLASRLVATPAVHVKPTIPNIAGTTYDGTFRRHGTVLPIEIAFHSESAAGFLTASIIGFVSTGAVKATRAVTLTGSGDGVSVNLAGKLSANLHTFTGKFTLKSNVLKYSVAFRITRTV